VTDEKSFLKTPSINDQQEQNRDNIVIIIASLLLGTFWKFPRNLSQQHSLFLWFLCHITNKAAMVL